jgi:hypothetical protein
MIQVEATEIEEEEEEDDDDDDLNYIASLGSHWLILLKLKASLSNPLK